MTTTHSSPTPAAAPAGATAPPQAPQAPQPPPPQPLIYQWGRGKGEVKEDADRFKLISELAKEIFNDQIPVANLHFSIGPSGLEFSFIGRDNQYRCQKLKPPSDADLNSPDPQVKEEAEINKRLFEAAAYITGVIPNPPAPAPAPAAPAPAAPAAAPQPPAAPAAAAPAAAALPAPGPAASQLQQSIDELRAALAALRANQAPPAYAPYGPPFPYPYPNQPPVAGAPQAAGAPQFHAQNIPQLQDFLVGYLRNQVPRLQQILTQMPQGPDRLRLELAITEINQNPPLILPALQATQLTIQGLVYNHLQTQATAANTINPAVIQPLGNQNGTPVEILVFDLLNNLPLNPAAHRLDIMFAAETALQTALRNSFQAEVPPFIGTLQQHGIAPSPALNALNVELAGAPPLTRLIAIDGELTASFRNILDTTVTRLIQDSQNLTAPFAFVPNAPAAGVPAAGQPIFANHTRAELTPIPLQILTAYNNYIVGQIGAAPQPAQIAALAPFAVGPNLLGDLEAKPAAILNAFRNYLNTAIERFPEDSQHRALPADPFAALLAKWNNVATEFKNYLIDLVNFEIRVGIPAQNSKKYNQMIAILGNIAAPAPGVHLLQPLLTALQAANPPPLNELLEIADRFKIFEEQQLSIFAKYRVATVVGVVALAALGFYLYAYGASLDGVYQIANKTIRPILGSNLYRRLGIPRPKQTGMVRRRPFNFDLD